MKLADEWLREDQMIIVELIKDKAIAADFL